MNETTSFKRLILRSVLRQVTPMVIRLVAVSDQVDLPEFHEIFRAILGWNSDLGYLIRVHGQEFNSFRRKTRCKALHEFKLHRQEKFLYVCDRIGHRGPFSLSFQHQPIPSWTTARFWWRSAAAIQAKGHMLAFSTVLNIQDSNIPLPHMQSVWPRVKHYWKACRSF